MSGIDVKLHYLLVSVLLSFLLLGLVFNVAGSLGYLITPIIILSLLLAGGVFSSPSRSHFAFLLLVLSFAVFMSIRIRGMTQLNLGFLQDQVVCLEARVVYDSSMTSNGNHLMKVMLSGCSTILGDRGSASGLVSVVGDRSEIITSGLRVLLEGHFSDSLFIYDRIQVLSRGRLNAFREYLIPRLQMRLLSDDGASSLSAMLLFGRSDFAENPIRDLAKNCGCSHILALSGMHLGIIASMCRRLFGNGKLGKAVSYVFVAMFVFIAGPRPSLVRAALSFALGSVAVERRSLLVLVLQMVIFPFTMIEIGCCYGYVAIFAIVYITPFLDSLAFQWIGKASKLFSATVSVMLLSAPIQMMINGQWYPAVIVASPLAGFLVACSMVLGLLMLALGRIGFLVRLNMKVFEGLKAVLTYFGSWKSSTWTGYCILVAALAAVVCLSFAVRAIARRMASDIFDGK